MTRAEEGDGSAPTTSNILDANTGTGTLPRTVVSIRGRDVDITDTGIDLDFLQALPEDMRADVIDQHLREQTRVRRQPTTNVPDASSTISPEFLDALPPDIRAEVILQETVENARRAQAESTQRQAPIAAAEPTSDRFLATLSSDLRDVMLLGASVDTHLDRSSIHALGTKKGDPGAPDVKKSRESIQLLEKPGIAALVRLLFFPEAFKKNHLFRILANLCENATTRADLLNLLLSVVQDGSGDLPTVDRSFQQMSLRAMTSSRPSTRSRHTESSSILSTPDVFSHLQTDNIPIFIAQRCLEALTHIVSANSQAVSFFLSEQEAAIGSRKAPAKKGKGKEKVHQSKFPIVILLELLERRSLLLSLSLAESLTALLANVTRPLTAVKSLTDENNFKRAEPQPVSATVTQQGNTSRPIDQPSVPVPSSHGKSAVVASSPVIPPQVLRLVSNCLTTGECSSRNFSQTLLVMQYLSHIPGAKDVLLQDIHTRAMSLGKALREELTALEAALQHPSFQSDHSALSAFSSPTSKQAQLLRLLKAIEYLHMNKIDSDPPGETLSSEERAVSDVYDSFDFGSIWTELRHCLTLIEARKDTEQIALVLLPLVETLMVVSKYRKSTPRDSRSPSIPPSSASTVAIEDLFLSFTTAHRKVLNAIVRTTPALLGGSFSLLIHNSRVLDFDNKRHWFFQKLKRKRDQIVPSGGLHLNVRRQYVFEDSFHALRQRTGDEIKHGKLSVKFYNEDGIDAGGVTREWYSVLAQQIFDPNFGKGVFLMVHASVLMILSIVRALRCG